MVDTNTKVSISAFLLSESGIGFSGIGMRRYQPNLILYYEDLSICRHLHEYDMHMVYSG